MYKIQSILFDKHNYTIRDALHFLTEHKYKHNKVDETDEFYRFRQIEPNLLRRQGYTRIRTKEIARGLKFIIYYKDSPRLGRDELL